MNQDISGPGQNKTNKCPFFQAEQSDGPGGIQPFSRGLLATQATQATTNQARTELFESKQLIKSKVLTLFLNDLIEFQKTVVGSLFVFWHLLNRFPLF